MSFTFIEEARNELKATRKLLGDDDLAMPDRLELRRYAQSLDMIVKHLTVGKSVEVKK